MADALVSVDENYMFRPPLESRLDDKVKASSDAAKLAAIDASLGSKVISYDPATGRPYWDATAGTHRIFTRYDGRPYAALTPDITTTTPSGRPALDL